MGENTKRYPDSILVYLKNVSCLFLFCSTHKECRSCKEGICSFISLFLRNLVHSFCRCQKPTLLGSVLSLFEVIKGVEMDKNCLETKSHKNRPFFLKIHNLTGWQARSPLHFLMSQLKSKILVDSLVTCIIALPWLWQTLIK